MTDAGLRALLAALLPLQALSAGLRSVAVSADVGSGGLREETAADRALDRGDLTRARVVSARLGQVSYPERECLRWLADRAHGALDVATAGRLYALHHAPMDLRERAQSAPWAAATARTAAAASQRVASRSASPEALALHSAAKARADAAAHREVVAETELCAWGVDRVAGAAAAWAAT